MESKFDFKEIKSKYPTTMSKEDFFKVAHIGRATALFLLQSGLVPCKDTKKKTRRYTIKTDDVIFYLEERIICPEKYRAPAGWYGGKSRPIARKKKSDANKALYFSEEKKIQLSQYFSKLLEDYDDLLSAKALADFLGYNHSAVSKWCRKKKLMALNISSKYYIPKASAIEFLCSDYSLEEHRKSRRHQLYLADFMQRNAE